LLKKIGRQKNKLNFVLLLSRISNTLFSHEINASVKIIILMLCLFFSLSSPFLFLALWENGKCLTSIQKENKRLHSENFLLHLRQTLEKNNHSLKEINKVYFTSTPSGQTGLRVSLAFISTLQVLNPKVKLYHIDTLLLQAGNASCVSLLTIDSRGNKYHVAVFQNKKRLLETQIISKEELAKILEKFPDFSLQKDCQNIDFLTNFQELKSNFSRLNKIEKINY